MLPFLQDVKLTDFPKDTLLGKDLKEYAKTFKEEVSFKDKVVLCMLTFAFITLVSKF